MNESCLGFSFCYWQTLCYLNYPDNSILTESDMSKHKNPSDLDSDAEFIGWQETLKEGIVPVRMDLELGYIDFKKLI
jgi:hypothetical protein